MQTKLSAASPYLALTAIEEFWDPSRPNIFLGKWCLRPTRSASWKPIFAGAIESKWGDPRASLEAYDYTNQLYERLLADLARALGSLHKIERNERYWRLILGPWLQLFVPSLFDRYCSLKEALALYPDLTTTLLSEASFLVPRDTLQFVYGLHGDAYNLQLYSRILRALGHRFPERDGLFQVADSIPKAHKPAYVEFAKSTLDAIGKMSVDHLRRHRFVILKDSYFSRKMEASLVWKTGLRVWRHSKPDETPAAQRDAELRRSIDLDTKSPDEFEGILRVSLRDEIPLCFVEGFKSLRQEATDAYPRSAAAIFSANAWYFKEVFKVWAAECNHQGTQLLGMQHGGNYGSIEPMPSEDHEITIVDRYYSWGWQRSDTHKVCPMPSAKLAGRTSGKRVGARSGMVYVCTSMPRYLVQFPFAPEHFLDYLEWQRQFLGALAADLFECVRVRLHYADLGWDIGDRLRESFPNVRFEKWDVPFVESLKNCRVYICDHLSTTFVEALSANVPTVLFWDPAKNPLRKAARPFYDGLRSAGILYEDPVAAAQALQKIYPLAEQWWQAEPRQLARLRFCEEFAKRVDDPADEWAREFVNVLRPDGESMVNR